MSALREMKDKFEGPFTLEGVVAFYAKEDLFNQATSIGRSFEQFDTYELCRLFREMVEFVGTDQKTAFSEAGFNKKRLDLALLTEDSLPHLDLSRIEVIWPIIQGDHMDRFFHGKRILLCAKTGLEKLCMLYHYCCRIQSLTREAKECEEEFMALGEPGLDYFSLQDLVRKLPKASAERMLEKCLPRLPAPELAHVLASGFSGLSSWKMSVKVFQTLPEKSRKVVCKWLFNERPALSELERSITLHRGIAGVFNTILSNRDEACKWTATRITPSRDASPTRK